MATDGVTAETVLARISAVADARIRPMFGECVISVDGAVIGQLNEGDLFIKTTKFGADYALGLETVPPIIRCLNTKKGLYLLKRRYGPFSSSGKAGASLRK